MAALRRVTWLGQVADDVPPLVVAPQPASDGWTRSEKILFAGVLINTVFLLFALDRWSRQRGSNVDDYSSVVRSGY